MGGLILSSIPAVFLNPMKIEFFQAKRITETGLPSQMWYRSSQPHTFLGQHLHRAAEPTRTPSWVPWDRASIDVGVWNQFIPLPLSLSFPLK